MVYYFGYCQLCNFGDASQTYDSILDFLCEHQETKHGKVETWRLIINRVNMPIAYWLAQKHSSRYWFIHNMKKKPQLIEARRIEWQKELDSVITVLRARKLLA